ncbi:MAG: hypothetical protein ACW981_18620 [Candidatus Hodarchaeales archaeon]|jgi:hypothetical protein
MNNDIDFLNEFLRFLVYQQFYRDKDIIVNRNKTQKILIPGSSKVISAFLDKCKPSLQYWDSNRSKFFDLFCSILEINFSPIQEYFRNQFEIDIRTENTPMLESKQLKSLALSNVYGQFYQRKINSIYNSIAHPKWNRDKRFGLLVNDYSLLVNILYLQQLAIFTGVKIKISGIIGKLLEPFESLDKEKFDLIIQKVKKK